MCDIYSRRFAILGEFWIVGLNYNTRFLLNKERGSIKIKISLPITKKVIPLFLS